MEESVMQLFFPFITVFKRWWDRGQHSAAVIPMKLVADSKLNCKLLQPLAPG